MEAQDPLSELADIHLPDPVSWWPPGPGWWLLLVVVIAGLTWMTVIWLKHQFRQKRLAAALNELDKAWKYYLSRTALDHKQLASRRGTETVKLLSEINATLKRVALVHFPETDVSSLTGRAWLEFLDSCDNTDNFTGKEGQVLGDVLYMASYDEDPAPVYRLAKVWIQRRYLLKNESSLHGQPLQEARG